MKSLLQINSLSAGYNGENVIQDITFDIRAGEILALVGESGSGKSTILKAITGLASNGVRLTAGGIHFKGIDMPALSSEDRRKLLGEEICTVFQNPSTSLNPIRKIRNQFQETIRSHRKMERDEALDAIRIVFKKLGLQNVDRVLNCCPFELSGGMCQRVTLALAMVMEPSLILADEPTSALDVMSQQQVIDEFRILREECGASIILVTHNIALAAHIADRTAIMHNGVIVETGETGRVLASPQHTYTKHLISDVPRIRTYYPAYSFAGRLLEVKSVTKTYNSSEQTIKAVEDLSFALSSGEVLGIVGESGSGKSTLARQILQLEKPDDGSIRYRGEEITTMKRHALRNLYRKAQMVFQIPMNSFDQQKKIRATLHDAVKNLSERKTSVAINIYIDELMNKVGLTPDMADRYPWELSGGQCQRAAIARSLAASPGLLICDEATSALDVSAQARIIDLLSNLVRDSGMSMIFISHDIALVSGLCNTMLVMKNGKCVDYGPTEQIITEPGNKYTRALLDAASFSVPQ